MLKELVEMLNNKYGLEGKDLEAVCFLIGAALGEALAIDDVAEHFQAKLEKVVAEMSATS